MLAMEVANPIYDVVFKHLMQDDRAARLLVGEIARLDVASLELRPQERVIVRDGDDGDRLPLTVIRMDFAARVRTANGCLRQVLIELQKAKAPTVVARFRRYLGEQLRDGGGLLDDADGGAVPIIAIYLLGYDLGLSEEPVIDVCPDVRERRTGRRLDAAHPFVASLHHRSHIVQIPRLAQRRRNDLERFLSIFDQAQQAAGDGHVLRIEESAYPEEWGFVLRQLRSAMAEEGVRRSMEAEDELLRDSMVLAQQADAERREKERQTQRADEQSRRADEERQEKERQTQRADEQSRRAEEQSRRADEQSQRAEEQSQRADEERQRAERTLARSVRQLHRLGQDAAEIAAALSIDVDEARRILSA